MSSLPAAPILASTLYASAQARNPTSTSSDIPFRPCSLPSRKRKRGSVNSGRTGCAAIDEVVLDGGFVEAERGGVVGLAVESASDGDGLDLGLGVDTLLLHQTLASHLLSTERTPAASTKSASTTAHFIDLSGAFSPHLLHRILLSRLRGAGTSRDPSKNNNGTFSHTGGYVYTRREQGSAGNAADLVPSDSTDDQTYDEDLRKRALQMMDAVSVIRVFDYVGMMEALGEVEGLLGLTMAGRADPGHAEAEGADRIRMSEVDEAHDIVQEAQRDVSMAREVADSDAGEDSAQSDEDDENDRPTHPSPTQQQPHAHQHQHQHLQQHLILLPNILHNLTPLLHTNHLSYHSLLTHLLRRLRLLARTYAALVVLGNGTVGGSHIQRGRTGAHGQGRETTHDNDPSVFEDVHVRPAGGRTLAMGLDVSVMVSRLPRGRVAHGASSRGTAQTYVVEVLADRFGGRMGRWLGVEVSDGVGVGGIGEFRGVRG